MKNNLNSVKWLQGVKFQPGTKPKGQQKGSKQPRNWGYRSASDGCGLNKLIARRLKNQAL